MYSSFLLMKIGACNAAIFFVSIKNTKSLYEFALIMVINFILCILKHDFVFNCLHISMHKLNRGDKYCCLNSSHKLFTDLCCLYR